MTRSLRRRFIGLEEVATIVVHFSFCKIAERAVPRLISDTHALSNLGASFRSIQFLNEKENKR
ncbi:MAG: hypothetical protein DMG35_09830 [Acidobacteria bacterium]|nr:MAG: hypothetical protein AUH86_20600 [Acidobacteria bacterium 13_1_40CM_4_58_4]PYT61158.1 MAG: hypothetical protein DMG35_09830 [Acidobacteriota bacterium]